MPSSARIATLLMEGPPENSTTRPPALRRLRRLVVIAACGLVALRGLDGVPVRADSLPSCDTQAEPLSSGPESGATTDTQATEASEPDEECPSEPLAEE